MDVAWLLCVRFSRFLGIAAGLRKNPSKDAAKCAALRDHAIMTTRKRQPLSRNKATTTRRRTGAAAVRRSNARSWPVTDRVGRS